MEKKKISRWIAESRKKQTGNKHIEGVEYLVAAVAGACDPFHGFPTSPCPARGMPIYLHVVCSVVCRLGLQVCNSLKGSNGFFSGLHSWMDVKR